MGLSMKYSVIFSKQGLKFLVVILLGSGLFCPEADAEETAGRPIEIFSGGKHYESMEGYRNKAGDQKDAIGLEDSGMEFTEVREMFDQAVRSSTKPLDLKFDPTKMKTIHIKPDDAVVASPGFSHSLEPKDAIKDPFAHSYTLLNKIGFNTAIKDLVSEFAAAPTAGREKKVVDANDLEKILRDSFGESNQPILLISDDNKLRVMTLDPKDLDTTVNAPRHAE
jgi:hypothetical protein